MTMVQSFKTFPELYAYGFVSSYYTMDATGERVGHIQQIYKAGNIAKILFYTGTVTTGDTIKASLQTVDMATGLPSGTVLTTATGQKAYGTVAVADGDDNVWKTVTLTEVAAVTQGQWIAVVLEWSSYGSGNIRINNVTNASVYTSNYSHYCVTDVTASPGTWVKDVLYQCLCHHLEYDDEAYYFNLNPQYMPGAAAGSVSSSTNPDEVGNYFQIPAKMRAFGFWLYGDFDYAVTLSLLDASDTTLANVVFDPDVRNAAAYGLHFILFDSDPAAYYTLATGTWYRIIITPGADAVAPRLIDVASAAAMGGLDGGTTFYATSRVDGGSWTNLTTRRWGIGLMIDQIDDGTGAGGSETIKGRSGSGTFLGMGKGN